MRVLYELGHLRLRFYCCIPSFQSINLTNYRLVFKRNTLLFHCSIPVIWCVYDSFLRHKCAVGKGKVGGSVKMGGSLGTGKKVQPNAVLAIIVAQLLTINPIHDAEKNNTHYR